MSNVTDRSIIVRIVAAIAAALFSSVIAYAQETETETADSTVVIDEKERRIVGKAIDFTQHAIDGTRRFINERLDTKDTLYISPNLYNWSFMVQYSNNYEYYRFATDDGLQSITFRPENANKVGLYLGWRWIFLGWSFDITENSLKNDFNFSFYTSKVGIDLFYRTRNKGYIIKDYNGFYDANGEKKHIYNRHFDDISTHQQGVNVYYIFNNKHFSYPAAYSQTTNQRISCGSFILGFNYSKQSFNIKYDNIDSGIREDLNPALMFNEVNYRDYSINFGYTYNWVFAKDFLANFSLTPAIGYKNTSFKLEKSSEFIKNINFDLITRAAVVYNNSRYYIGASFVSHSYSYRKQNLSIDNGFGTLNLYMGINVFKRKK